MRNIFEGSFNEEGMVPRKDILEGVFKCSASEARKKLDITASADRGAIGEQLGRNQGVSNCWLLMINKK